MDEDIRLKEGSIKGRELLRPRQPLLVLDASTYDWIEIMVCGISHCYTFKATRRMIDKALIVPDGSVDLLINCTAGFPDFYFIGSPTRVVDIHYIKGIKEGDIVFGVRFLPGRAWWPDELPMDDLTDNGIPVHDICRDTRIMAAIAQEQDFIRQVQIFMSYYMDCYQREYRLSNRIRLSNAMVTTITQNKGMLSIRELAGKMGYTERYLNRVFHDAAGMSPKMFSEIIRFQQVLRDIKDHTRIADISENLNYFDQSHLLKTFKRFVGMSPQCYLKILSNQQGIAV